MALTPEQHAQVAAVYDKCAADHMVPPPQRAAFARKAEMFRMLFCALRSQAKIGLDAPARPKRPTRPCERTSTTLAILECSQRRGIYLRGAASVAWQSIASHPVSIGPRLVRVRHKRGPVAGTLLSHLRRHEATAPSNEWSPVRLTEDEALGDDRDP